MKQIQLTRHLAWQALIEANICEFPVDIYKIAAKYKIDVILYSELKKEIFSKKMLDCCGFFRTVHGVFNGIYQSRQIIFLNDISNDSKCIRVALSVLVGYILIGNCINREIPDHFLLDENQIHNDDLLASIFAKEVLMPSCVLSLIDSNSTYISERCAVPVELANSHIKHLNTYQTKTQHSILHSFEEKIISNFNSYISSLL